MRLFIGAGVFCLFAACDEGHVPSEATPSQSVIRVAQFPEAISCYAVRSVDATGKAWFASGDPHAHLPTRSEAEAAGQICGKEIAVVSACGAGLEHEAEVVLTGVYTEADGMLIEDTVVANPCPEPGTCTRPFTCEAGMDTEVDFNLTLVRDSSQGFFDIFVDPRADDDISELCIAISVEAGDGSITWHQSNLCSSRYGTSSGAVGYVGSCDADAPRAKVHYWIESIRGVDPEARFVNPCPADGGYDLARSCSVEATCIENNDVVVRAEPQLTR